VYTFTEEQCKWTSKHNLPIIHPFYILKKKKQTNHENFYISDTKWLYKFSFFIILLDTHMTGEFQWRCKAMHLWLLNYIPLGSRYSAPIQAGPGVHPAFCTTGKGNAVPLQAWSGPEGSRKLRFPDYMTTAQDGGKVVSLMHRLPLLPGTHFC
jgi:hypothetical protein